jgi:hypothetical protein
MRQVAGRQPQIDRVGCGVNLDPQLNVVPAWVEFAADKRDRLKAVHCVYGFLGLAKTSAANVIF